MPDADAKRAKALDHATKARGSAARVMRAVKKGEPVDLADAKVLEAAGCWLRRNMVAA